MEIITRLKDELDRIVKDFEKPAAEFAEAIAGLVEEGQWDDLKKVLPEEAVNQIRDSYNADPTRTVREWREAAVACNERFVEDASKRLIRLSRSNSTKLEPNDFAEWLQINFDLKGNLKGDLLSVAFAYKLVGLINPAAARARELKELVVAEASYPEADSYLSEATECYVLGLYSASAVMCRSLLEEALERKLDQVGLLAGWESEAKGYKLTLGTLLWKVRIHHKQNKQNPPCVSPNFLGPATRANELATLAAHTKTIGQPEARECLLKTQEAITILLGGVSWAATGQFVDSPSRSRRGRPSTTS